MRVSKTSAVLAVVAVVLAVVAQRVFVAAHRPLSWAAAAVVVAVLVDPLVDLVDRHAPRIPRFIAVLFALVLVGGAMFGVMYRAFADLGDAVTRFGEAAEDAASQLEARDDGIGQLATDVDATRRVELFVDTLDERVTGGEDVLAQGAGSAPTYFIGAILTLFLMSYGPRLARSAVAQIRSPEQRRLVSEVVPRALGLARRAVLFTLAEAIVVGLLVTGVARLLDMPAPTALGLAAGLFAILPHVGLVLGSLPLILLVLAMRSDAAAIVLTVAVIAGQMVDSLVIRPAIARRSVRVGLLVPWVVILIGYRIYGVGGAAYGLAFAVFALALLDELGAREGPQEPEEPPAVPDEAEPRSEDGPTGPNGDANAPVDPSTREVPAPGR